ncbi:MAG: hypothetical protein SXA11_02205 [Cyanobacteriota bacterium]|nr:hypothetical protein [Cyanobacteriota bacterium]
MPVVVEQASCLLSYNRQDACFVQQALLDNLPVVVEQAVEYNLPVLLFKN